MKKIITLVAASALTVIEFSLTNAHSWVACTDYRGDVNIIGIIKELVPNSEVSKRITQYTLFER